ncbi:ArsC/Spx/MgsR family protein [Lactococcus garvieae]|uniref:ArsC/Spx/MgsR family protein n=1 Tax=Lactococcus garvieae TaxID=1363 RepID=UPI0038534C8E
MINIYCRNNTYSSNKALTWFTKHNISVSKYPMNKISWEELIHLLSLTDNGIVEIIKSIHKVSPETKIKIDYLMDLNFNEGLYYMKAHSEILQDPIIMENNKYLVGYHKEEIRQFIPSPRVM